MRQVTIPAKFWGTISADRFHEIVVNGGYLNEAESRLVFRMQDLTAPEPMECLQVVINAKELDRAIAEGFGKKDR